MLELIVPVQAEQCIALLKRMPKGHPVRPTVEKDLRLWLKGYYGELNVAYYLSFLPEDEYYIFHGLRLMDKKSFQMDLLLISSKFALIIEVKNISGKLKFNKGSDLMTRELNNLEEGMDNPIQQVKRHHLQFTNWLKNKQFKGIPLERLVVISKTSTIIETTPDNLQIFQKLIYAESLLDKIRELEVKYTKPRITKKTLTRLSDTLLQNHKIEIPDVFQKYNLNQSDIKPGVQCPKCDKFGMEYISASWRCSKCEFISKKAHLLAINDYFLILNQSITRKQLAAFLQIDPMKARNILLTTNLPSTGTKRGTKYFLPKNCIFSPHDENSMKKGEFFT
ncbi:nuclease-related domain-containing protein [Bacillus sp. OK048]|uniref:nuclease-related domain-containing protein n=1 Tax=Bacillus sp. OK048 TaxID=1882761 RepID=UPI0020C8F1F8|nr:nuclease-related domain-containing protein [Bacillus sp. OK048]